MLYLHGIESFTNSIQGVSMWALRKGFAQSLFLTANADTYYFWGNINLQTGPMVVETPPDTLGIFDDFWFRYISDFWFAGT